MIIDLAIIGGTGLYQLPELENLEMHVIDTPYGATSAPIVSGVLDGYRLAFLARHGEKHTVLPHRINYRANIWALHTLGSHRVISVNAVGGIRNDMAPRKLVVPDQIIDYTHGRITSFCDCEDEDAAVNHIDFSEPYSSVLRHLLIQAAMDAKIAVIGEGVYGATQGPRLETRAEIARMRRDGCDLVGMTGMPEAALARELNLEYACLALVANWAAGCDPFRAPEISLEEIRANLELAKASITPILKSLLKKIQ